MALNAPKYNNVKDYLREVQTDIVIPWGTVHDEIDYCVLQSDNNLHHAILKRMCEIHTIKDKTDKLGMPYINFTFDIEWDDKKGTWLPEMALAAYKYPRNRQEAQYKKDFEEALAKLKGIPTEKVEPNLKEYEMDLTDESEDKIAYWFEKIDKASDGDTIITIKTKDGDFEYNRPIKLSDI